MDVKELIKSKGYDSITVANAIGMHSNSFYKRVNGRVPFKANEIRDIAKFLGVTDAEVLFATFETKERYSKK